MTTQFMEPDVDEALDLSDLDLLDDIRHIFCAGCNPPEVWVVQEAICGKRALVRSAKLLEALPPDACPDCSALWDSACPKCSCR